MERVLASIRKISQIIPILGADNIEAARIDGWTVAVKKGEFSVGQLCIYCEIDSILPERPEFEFLRAKHFRIKTLKLNKFNVLSQGIAFQTSILELVGYKLDYLEEGMDVTNILGVTKYEIPEHVTTVGVCKSTFPADIPKTDEERVQNLRKYLDEWRDIEFVVSEKVDGTSATYVIRTSDAVDGIQFDVCSRNMTLLESDNVYWKIARKYNLDIAMKNIFTNASNNLRLTDFAIQGEIVGPGVQSNRLGLNELEFFMFNAFDIKRQRYLTWDELTFLATILGIKTVPVLLQSFSLNNISDEQLLDMANGPSLLNDKVIREGLVFRSKNILSDFYQFNKVSFKSISNDYILKYGL